MDGVRDIVVFIASLGKDPINRKVAQALAELAPSSLGLSVGEIGHLPVYDQDAEASPLERKRVKADQAVLFVTAEHKCSMPAAMKSAMDIGSRPYNQSTGAASPELLSAPHPMPLAAWRQSSSVNPSWS